MACALHEQVCIVPKYNMITNIGLSENGVHTTNNIKKLPKKSQQYYFTKGYDIEFPLKHPKYVVEDRHYYNAVTKKFKMGLFDYMEMFARQLVFGGLKDIQKLLKLAFKNQSLSARSFTRILKVARTIADLAGREKISVNDVAEAIQYKTKDLNNDN